MSATVAMDAAAGRSVVYVYGVAQAPHRRAPAAPRPEGIVPEAPVEPLVQGDLMAFVSSVPEDRFGADAFRAALKDTEWLKTRILAHERVLEDLRASHTVVPFRFGTIYRDSSRVSDALARHRFELSASLGRIRGASEWGVKLYCDGAALRRRLAAESAALRETGEALAQASPGAGFFLQKKLAKALDGEAGAAVAAWVDRIHRSLDGCARESVATELQPPAVHGRPADMVMNAAYLVADDRRMQFRRKLARLNEQFSRHGFEHELTGPWPPYHFVSLGEEKNAHAAASGQ